MKSEKSGWKQFAGGGKKKGTKLSFFSSLKFDNQGSFIPSFGFALPAP
jgi:hypothetical protein